MNPRRRQKGFTLLEVVVSIAILALMVLMISLVFNTGSRAVRRGSVDALLDDTARFVFDNLQTDISQALVRTNIPLRVESISSMDTLYFISTAVRRQQETNLRDTAPVQVRGMKRMKMVSQLNQRVVFEYPTGTTQNSDNARVKMIEQSDFYRSGKINLGGEMEYTEPMLNSERLTAQAVLTFMEFRINGDSSSNISGLPQVDDLPRFVDVVIGLTAANDMLQAMRLYDRDGQSSAEDYLGKNEQVYTRRIFFLNTGITGLTFE